MSALKRLAGRHWFVISLAAAGAGALAAALTLVLPTQYRAESTLLVSGPEATRELQLTYAQLMMSDEYLEFPAAALGLDVEELRDGLRAIPSPGALLISVNVSDSDEESAVDRANAVAGMFATYLSSSGFDEAGTVDSVRQASSGERTSGLRGNAIMGAAAGALAALAAMAFFTRRARERLRVAQNEHFQAAI